jgi:hypothetical protein
MPLGDGAERVLAELAEAPLADQAWLRALRAFGELHARPGRDGSQVDAAPVLVAVLLMQR